MIKVYKLTLKKDKNIQVYNSIKRKKQNINNSPCDQDRDRCHRRVRGHGQSWSRSY